MKKRKMSLAEQRGVFKPFEYQKIAAILVLARIEDASRTLVQEIRAERWERNVFGKPIYVEGLAYNPFQLEGHKWTTILGAPRIDTPSFDDDLAKKISKRLQTKTIFYVYESVSGVTQYQLFDKGNLVEILSFDGSAKGIVLKTESEFEAFQKKGSLEGFYFYSTEHRLNANELTNKNFTKVLDDFFKRQNSLLFFYAGCDVENSKATFTISEGTDAAVLRADLVGIHPARIISEAQLLAEKKANDAAEKSTYNYAMSMLPDEDLPSPRPLTKKHRIRYFEKHKQCLEMLKKYIDRGIKVRDYWLWEAAQNGNKELADLLIEAGTDVNTRPHRSTPLEAALRNGYQEIADSLIKAGAKDT